MKDALAAHPAVPDGLLRAPLHQEDGLAEPSRLGGRRRRPAVELRRHLAPPSGPPMAATCRGVRPGPPSAGRSTALPTSVLSTPRSATGPRVRSPAARARLG